MATQRSTGLLQCGHRRQKLSSRLLRDATCASKTSFVIAGVISMCDHAFGAGENLKGSCIRRRSGVYPVAHTQAEYFKPSLQILDKLTKRLAWLGSPSPRAIQTSSLHKDRSSFSIRS